MEPYIYVYILTVGLVALGCLLYIVRNLYSKNKIYEQWIVDTQDDVEKLYSDMQELDSKQMFEKDDEVGALFQQLITVIGELRGIIYEEEEKEET